MAYSSRKNIDRVLQLTEQGPYAKKKDTGSVRATQANTYSNMLAGEQPLYSSYPLPANAVNEAGGRSINTRGYSKYFANEGSDDVGGVSATGEKPVATYSTDTNTSYMDRLTETEKLAQQQYDSSINYAEKIKESEYKQADDAHRIAMRDAQANYQINNPRYGVSAENMLSNGLAGSGYGEYLA